MLRFVAAEQLAQGGADAGADRGADARQDDSADRRAGSRARNRGLLYRDLRFLQGSGNFHWHAHQPAHQVDRQRAFDPAIGNGAGAARAERLAPGLEAGVANHDAVRRVLGVHLSGQGQQRGLAGPVLAEAADRLVDVDVQQPGRRHRKAGASVERAGQFANVFSPGGQFGDSAGLALDCRIALEAGHRRGDVDIARRQLAGQHHRAVWAGLERDLAIGRAATQLQFHPPAVVAIRRQDEPGRGSNA